MPIEFDAEKDRANIAKHGISLARAADLEILAFTDRQGALRAISLRRARRKEMDRHVPKGGL
jgi:uncharacterized DUF497 family protein